MKSRRPGDPAPLTASNSAGGNESDVPVHAAEDLFGGRREIMISHDGHLYRLKITRLGKLILTK